MLLYAAAPAPRLRALDKCIAYAKAHHALGEGIGTHDGTPHLVRPHRLFLRPEHQDATD